MTFTIRRSILVVVVSLAVVAAGVLVAQRASAVSATPVVYVATGENFPDALGAASAAAVQAGPVLLVTRDSIPAETAAELQRLSPDVICVSGGTAVVSDAVFTALKAYAPTVTRVAGANRYATAVEVSKSAFPVAATGGGDVAALTAAVNALTSRVSALEADNAALEGEVDALQATLAGVSRDGSTLLFSGMNLQVVNGEGSTDTSNSLGNVIIGYNEDEYADASRSGSHYLIVGSEHSYTSYAGIVAGWKNVASGPHSSVTGGLMSTASGAYASVSGGREAAASGDYTSVSGGYHNTASGNSTSIAGGDGNSATNWYASVFGGTGNIASGRYSSVTGGRNNTASDYWAVVNGGEEDGAGRLDTVIGSDSVTCDVASNAAICGEGYMTLPD